MAAVGARVARHCSLLLLCACAACAPAGQGDQQDVRHDSKPPPTAPPGDPHTQDEDHDFILDRDEGRETSLDSDGDGVPDYQDLDSDNDGLSDAVEAGDGNLATPPIDTDGDRVADFRDEDSDGDTVPDASEMACRPGELAPVDSDGDGLADFRDPDSDGDGIGDIYEGERDTDDDGFPDRCDPDSDGDGIADADESDAAIPRDADGDGIADYREVDADNDGLLDQIELRDHHTSPSRRDTDGDGDSDLVETIAGTDPNDAQQSPKARGELYFVVPYQEAAYPPLASLRFRPAVQLLDLYFAFDASASMNEEYAAMRHPRTGIASIVGQLTCAPDPQRRACETTRDCPPELACGPAGVCIEDPAKSGCIPNIWTGVGTFGNIDSFRNLLALQSDPLATAAAIPVEGQVARPDGPQGRMSGPWAEAPYQAPACVCDGDYCKNPDIGCVDGGLGCPGFRFEAVRVYVQISDADNQCADPSDVATGTSVRDFGTTFFGMGRCAEFDTTIAGRLLANLRVRFIGLYGETQCAFTDPDCDNFPQGKYNAWVRKHAPERPEVEVKTPRSVMEDIGAAAKSVDTRGRPFVYRAMDGAVVNKTVTAVREIIRELPMRVQIDVADVQEGASDAVDAAAFVARLAATGDGEGCTHGIAVTDSNGDGAPDEFPRLTPGTSVCWTVVPRPVNDLVQPGNTARVVRARLTVYGDGSPLDRRDIYFVIPAAQVTVTPPADPVAQVHTVYYPSGRKQYASSWQDGLRHGDEQWWSEDGELTRACTYERGHERVCKTLSREPIWNRFDAPLLCPPGTAVVERSTTGDVARTTYCAKPDGARHGPYVLWFDRERRGYFARFLDDRMHGSPTCWDRSGLETSFCTLRPEP